MSRSEPNQQLQNPATRFFDFAGGTGQVEFYDKESKTNIPVDLPFKFLVLDEVMTVGGGYDDGNKFIGYYSTSIRSQNAKKEPITVWSSVNGKARVEKIGLWSEIKGSLTGAKYIKGLYITWYNDETRQMEVGYLKIRGAALMPWVEFNQNRRDVCQGVFSIVGNTPKKKGTNSYFEPVFEWSETVKPEVEEKALELDKDLLQPYLKSYFEQRASTDTEKAFAASASDDAPAEDEKYQAPDDDYPF